MSGWKLTPKQAGLRECTLREGETTVLGRGPATTSIDSARCSRRQLAFDVAADGLRCAVRCCGPNASCVVREGKRHVLRKDADAAFVLEDGDEVQFLDGEFPFAVAFVAPPPPPPKPQQQQTPPPAVMDAAAAPAALAFSPSIAEPPATGSLLPSMPSLGVSPDQPQQQKKQPCKYGAKCYRQNNPEHTAKYSHPPAEPAAPISPTAVPAAADAAPLHAAAAAAADLAPAGMVRLGLHSLGTGVLRFDPNAAAAIACAEIQRFLERAPAGVGVVLAEGDPRVRGAFAAHRGPDERFVVVNAPLARMRSEGMGCAFVAVEVNWRWKPADPTMAAALGSGFHAAVSQRHPATAQVSHVYHTAVPRGAPLAEEEGVEAVLLCVPPNAGNPSKPDFVPSIATAEEQLRDTYRTLFEVFGNVVRAR